jgi:amino acid transporter
MQEYIFLCTLCITRLMVILALVFIFLCCSSFVCMYMYFGRLAYVLTLMDGCIFFIRIVTTHRVGRFHYVTRFGAHCT